MKPIWNVGPDGTPEELAKSVEWMKQHVARINDQGRWVIPRSGSIVVVDHVNKQMIRVFGLMPETSTKKVVEAMGWKWIEKEEV